MIPACETVMAIAVREAVVVVGKEGGRARVFSDEIFSIPTTTQAIHYMSFGVSIGQVIA